MVLIFIKLTISPLSLSGNAIKKTLPSGGVFFIIQQNVAMPINLRTVQIHGVFSEIVLLKLLKSSVTQTKAQRVPNLQPDHFYLLSLCNKL